MNSKRLIHFLVFDGFADWEPGYALAELRRSGGRSVRVLGFTETPVVSMGGLKVLPDARLESVAVDDVELLLLPGGDMWESAGYPRAALDSLLVRLVAEQTPVAAICGATLALARAGILNARRHTSNMRSYLTAHAPEYAGAAYYDEQLAVRDQHVITASGLGAVDFAKAIFAELQVFSASDEALWYGMFKDGRVPAGAI
jgi:putative intracellular protease/amidase